MVRLPKNYGVYDCANVEMYRTTNDSKLGDKVGQYCLRGRKVTRRRTHALLQSCRKQMESKAMFNSLDEQIERTEGERPSAGAQLVRFVWIVVLSVVAFGGLYLAIVALE